MTVINTNVGALMARTYASKAAQKTELSMERLSSGLRINGSADDAAGMAVANKMKSQLLGIKMAIRNSQDGISLVQTAESGMSEISNMILRMRELAVQMENGIYTAKDRDNAQLEVNALLQEIDKIAVNTRFNDVNLLDGNYDQSIRAGNTNAETIRVAVDGLKTSDTAKITEFAVEKATAESGVTIGDINDNDAADGSDAYTTSTNPYTYAYDSDTASASEPAAGATNIDTVQIGYGGADEVATSEKGAVYLMADDGYYNVSNDGADGVDADGTDTDLTVLDGVDFKIDTSVFSTTFKDFFKADSLGTFTLEAMTDETGHAVADGDDTAGGGAAVWTDVFAKMDTDSEVTDQFTINAKTGDITLTSGVTWDHLDLDASADTADETDIRDADYKAVIANNFWAFNVRYTARDGTSHVETINLAIKDATESQLDDIKVESQAESTRAIETLDKALGEVSSAQAKLGAIQNRLQHNIDNLSKGSMLTEQAVGRVVDADFAAETSNLSKQQILNQAATAMLAQANQSKQSVLALLQ